MMKRLAVAAAVLSVAALSGCAASGAVDPAATAEPTAVVPHTPTPAPAPTATSKVLSGVAFGTVQDVSVDTSKWQIAVEQPKDVTAELVAQKQSLGLEIDVPDGSVAMAIDGTIRRVSGGLAAPGDELRIDVIANATLLFPSDSTMQEYDDLDDVPGLTDGGSGDFRTVFYVPAQAPITSVLVSAGKFDLSTAIVFGETLWRV